MTIWQAQHRGMLFELTSSTNKSKCHVKMKGSWHSFWNKGKGNSNTFTDLNAHEAVDKFEKVSNTKAIDWHLKALEYGVNMSLGIKPSHHYNNLFSWGNRPATDMISKYGGHSNSKTLIGKVIAKGQVHIKWYNKSAQQHYADNQSFYKETPNDITRVEIRAVRRNILRAWCILTLEDLRRARTYECLKTVFIGQFACINIVPKLQPTEAMQLDKSKLYRYGLLRDTDKEVWISSTKSQRRTNRDFIRKVCTSLGLPDPKEAVQILLTQGFLDTNNTQSRHTAFILVKQKLKRLRAMKARALSKLQEEMGRPWQWLMSQVQDTSFAYLSHDNICRLDFAISPSLEQKWQVAKENLVL